MRQSPTSISDLRIGLVLSGGGGKGAYQIGCWRALQTLGIIRFEVISGTSVGALNGALIGMGDYDRAERIWSNLEECQVLEADERRKRNLLIRLVVIASFKWLLLHVAMLMFVAFMAAFITISFAAMKAGAGLPIPLPTMPLEFYWHRLVQSLFSLPVWAWTILGCFYTLLLWSVVGQFRDGDLGTKKFEKLIESTAISIGERTAVGSNQPLFNLIKSNISLERLAELKSRVFATITVQYEYWDPFLPKFVEINEPVIDPDRPWRYRQPKADEYDKDHVPGPYIKFMSDAVEISSLKDNDQVCMALLQSANLPMVFRKGRWEGKAAMDGGLTDNTPIFPAAEHGCDVIIVIYLSHKERPDPAQINTTLGECYMANIQRSMTETEARELYRKFCRKGRFEDPVVPFSISNQQMVFVVPSQSLGSTMDFTGGQRARRLMDLGERDMINALRQHPLFKSYERTPK